MPVLAGFSKYRSRISRCFETNPSAFLTSTTRLSARKGIVLSSSRTSEMDRLVAVDAQQRRHALLGVQQLIDELLGPGPDERLVLACDDVDAISHERSFR